MRRVTLVTHPRDNDLEELFVSILQHVKDDTFLRDVLRGHLAGEGYRVKAIDKLDTVFVVTEEFAIYQEKIEKKQLKKRSNTA